MRRLSEIPIGVKLIAVLHWACGIIAILILFFQVTKLGYLPSHLRFFIWSVTFADSVLLFVIGAGILTMKRRWFNIALIVSAASLVAFYIVPLRPALPLEIGVIVYLYLVRREPPKKTMMLAIPIILMLFSSLPISTTSNIEWFVPDRTAIKSYELKGSNGCMKVVMTLYKELDAIKTTDFYYLQIDISCSDRDFNYAVVNACVTTPNAEGNSWNPNVNPGQVFQIGMGVTTFSMGPVQTVNMDFGKNESCLCWQESFMFYRNEESFSSEYLVPEGSNFTWVLSAEMGLKEPIFGKLWSDTLGFTSISQ